MHGERAELPISKLPAKSATYPQLPATNYMILLTLRVVAGSCVYLILMYEDLNDNDSHMMCISICI
jgi:hypothetical protein